MMPTAAEKRNAMTLIRRSKRNGTWISLARAEAKKEGNCDAGDAADAGERDCLHEKLQQHLPGPRADGEADADLAGALVTLTSMMFMMPIPPTSRLTPATAASSMVIILVEELERLGDLAGVEDVKIVILIAIEIAPGAHERSDVGDKAVAVRAVLGGNRDLRNVARRGAPREAALQGGDGHDDGVVPISPCRPAPWAQARR